MDFVVVWSYDNYVPAHLALGRLEEEGIHAWLKDENMVTVTPMFANAMGGIKLLVKEDEAEKAWKILNGLEQSFQSTQSCPFCKSHNIQYVSSPRKPLNWVMAIFTSWFTSFALSVEKVYHCFNCGKEFDQPVSNDPEQEAV